MARRRRTKGSGRPQRVSTLLPELAAAGGWSVLVEMARLQLEWKEVVGESIAIHTMPEKIVRGRLTVLVDSSPWLAQLGFFKDEIKRKTNSLLGSGRVGEVFLQVGRIKRDEPRIQRPKARELTSEEMARVEADVAEVPDEEVRQALKGLIERDLKNR